MQILLCRLVSGGHRSAPRPLLTRSMQSILAGSCLKALPMTSSAETSTPRASKCFVRPLLMLRGPQVSNQISAHSGGRDVNIQVCIGTL
jgi:hypothetical protein